MKRLVLLFLIVLATLSFTACSTANKQAISSENSTSEIVETDGNTQAGKVLIAYFSWAENAVLADNVDVVTSPSVVQPGNVQQLAEWIQEQTGGDVFSIRVTDPYPSDWDACLSRANQERGDEARPELVENVSDISQYDTIFLGYPKMEQGYICV